MLSWRAMGYTVDGGNGKLELKLQPLGSIKIVGDNWQNTGAAKAYSSLSLTAIHAMQLDDAGTEGIYRRFYRLASIEGTVDRNHLIFANFSNNV